jgi:hypothetical protein
MEIEIVLHIPLLVTIHARARSGVIEAKDEALALSPRRVRDEIDKYYRSTTKGHQAKLRQNRDDIAKDPLPVARTLGYDEDVDWPIRGLFVTRFVYPGAFDERREFDFFTVDRLSPFLANGADR